MTSAMRLLAAGAAPAWTPASLSGLTGWWDASNAASITSSGGEVSAWADLSSAGNTLVQSVATKYPLTGSATINSLNTLTFDGTNDFLDKTSFTGLNIGTNAATVLAVFSMSSNNSYVRIICCSTNAATMDNNNVSSCVLLERKGTLKEINGYRNSTQGNVATFSAWDTPLQATTRINGTTQTAWVNGTAGADATWTASNLASTYVCVGADPSRASTSFLKGNLGELIVYNVALSATDRQTVESYLKTKWGTP